jgi:hypothetical protein
VCGKVCALQPASKTFDDGNARHEGGVRCCALPEIWANRVPQNMTAAQCEFEQIHFLNPSIVLQPLECVIKDWF